MIKWIVAAMLFACSAHAKKAEKAMDWKGQNGGPIDAGAVIIADANAWTNLWRTLGQSAPALDFTKYFAVAVFAGERMTGGYGIEFLEPSPKGEDLIVRYRIKAPTGFTTQALTQPWMVRVFKRVKGKVSAEAVPPEAKSK
jgi:hypothetical protein